MSAEHNHPPRCCCASLDMGASYAPADDHCPGCVVHGVLAAEPPINLTNSVGLRSQPGVHHSLDCPRRTARGADCVCGREGERDAATPYTEQETTNG